MEIVVEIDHLIDKIRESQTRSLNWESDASEFIALFGCHDAGYQGTLNLDDEFNHFLSSDTLKTLLLVGHSGAGKSFYTRALVTRLWKNFSENDPIPLWISLPNCKKLDNAVIEEALTICGLNETQIETLKSTNRWIFVFDGYDEVRLTKNLFHSNSVGKWNAKTIFTCRHEYLYYLDNFKSLFSPYENGYPIHTMNTVLYVKPFSTIQISDYLKQYIHTHETEWGTCEEYENVFGTIPGLMELIKTPYFLKLAVESAPIIVKQFSKEKKEHLTRAALMDIFFMQWFSREEAKLKAVGAIPSDKDIQPEFWQFGKELAQLMHEKQIKQVEYDPEEENLFDNEAEKNPFTPYFDMTIPRVTLLQTACFIRKVGCCHYAFAHEILGDYFLTRGLYDAITNQKVEKHSVQVVITKNKSQDLAKDEVREKPKKSTIYFNKELISKEDQAIQLHADRVINDKSYMEKMFEYLYSSRNNKSNLVQSSNALSILVKAGVSFNGADLSNLYLYGANFSGGYFDSASLKGTDLATAELARGWFRNADFTSSNVAGVDFGQNPWFEHDDPVYCVDYKPDIKRLAVGAGEKIIIWDLVSCEKIKELSGHKGIVTNVILTPDGKFLFSGGMDGNVLVWDLNANIYKSIGNFEIVYRLFFNTESGNLIVSALQQLPNKESRYGRLLQKQGVGSLEPFPVREIVEIMSPYTKENPFGSWENSSEHDCTTESGTAYLNKTVKVCNRSERVGAHNDSDSVIFTKDGKLQIWHINENQVKVVEENERYVEERWQYKSARKSIGSCTGNNVDEEFIKNLRKTKFPLNKGTFITKKGKFAIVYESQSSATYWDIDGKKKEEIIGHTGPVTSAYVSEEGLIVLTGSEDCSVRVWDVIKNKGFPLLWHHKAVTCVTLSQDNKTLISGSLDKKVFVRDFNALDLANINRVAIRCVSMSRYSKFIACIDENGIFRLYNLHTKAIKTIDLKTRKLEHLNFLCIREERNIVILTEVGADEYLYSLNLDNDDIQKLHSDDISDNTKIPRRSIFISEDGNISASLDGNALIIHDLVNLKRLVISRCDNLQPIDISKYGKTIIYVKGNNIECLTNFSPYCTLKGHKKAVTYVRLCRDLTTIISVSDDKTVRKWNMQNQKQLDIWKCGRKFKRVNISEDGAILLSQENQEAIQIWDINSKTQISTIQFPTGIVSLTVDSQIKKIAASLSDGSIQMLQCSNDARKIWNLLWSSECDRPNALLNLSGCDFTNAKGLTAVNRRLVAQHGALISPENSNIPSVAKRTGSPIYHNSDDTIPGKEEKCVIF